MKITANAGAFADALALAASINTDNKRKRPEVLEAVHLSTDEDELRFTANVLDHMLVLSVPVVVEVPGELVVSGSRLAALASGFPDNVDIEIAGDGIIARISCGRSRFKLPTIPLDNLPPALKLTEEIGRTELAREQALKVFRQPSFAISTEKTRYYLCGVMLHDDDGGLAAVATDGHRLCRARVPGAAGLSQDCRLIVPSAAVKIIAKLLGDKNVERVTLRRSRTLFALETGKAVFASRLIDGTFPDYRKFVPKPSGNAITVDRASLMQALDRVAAVVEPHQRAVAGLTWSADEAALHVCLADSDAADDVVVAEVTGSGKAAVQIKLLVELLDALAGGRVHLDSRSGSDPILITDLDDQGLLTLQMPCQWSLAQAA